MPIIARDPINGKIAEIFLAETALNSSIFEDHFINRLSSSQSLWNQKWSIDASDSMIYDSDILLHPINADPTTAYPSFQGGGRTDGNILVEHQLFNTSRSQMSLVGNGNYMWSFNPVFAAGDPTDLTLNAPYSLKGVWRRKQYELTFVPGFETLDMDYNNTSGGVSRPDILNSFTGEIDWLLAMRSNWLSNTTFNIRHDQSLLPDGGPDDATAMKYEIFQEESFFINPEKTRAFQSFVGFTYNAALGINEIFNRIEAGGLYSAPLKKFQNVFWDAAATVYHMTYPNKEINVGQKGETDDDTTLAAGLTKYVNSHWSGMFTASYTTNTSNVDTSKYNKYVVMATIDYHWDGSPQGSAGLQGEPVHSMSYFSAGSTGTDSNTGSY